MLHRYAVAVFAVLLFCIFLSVVCMPVSAITEPVPTRWMSPDGTPALAHKAPQYPQPLIVAQAQDQPLSMAPLAAPNGRIALVVNDSIYNGISQAITEYCWDLQAFGYDTIVYRFVSGSATSLRSYLAGLYAEPAGLKGAILIGNIPYIIYEMMQSWGGGVYEYEDFPCDIFYMDLNGTWSDSLTNGSVQPNNGKYDTRGGDLALEIWVGRIKADNLTNLGSETSVTNSYFNKVHNYRTRTSIPNKLAIVYDDDDWSNMASGDVSAIQGVFGSGFVYGFSNPDSTTASDYKTYRLPTSTRWYLIRSHGYPGGHGFYRSGKTVFDYVFASDYTSMDPPASFYSLFVCSGCDYTAGNNLGGTIALNPQSQGLFSLGSTKTGGMWQDDYFYNPMADQKSMGESFRLWFN